MYKLYWSPGSGAIAPQVLLEEIGAQYEKIVVDIESDENQSSDFLAVNPLGQIPALVLPDGTLMTESAAIVLQICDRHPEANFHRHEAEDLRDTNRRGCGTRAGPAV